MRVANSVHRFTAFLCSFFLLGLASSMAAGKTNTTITLKNDGIAFLSWDSEGGTKNRINLLRAGVTARVGTIRVEVPDGVEGGGFDVVVERKDAAGPAKAGIEIDFPFNARVTPTTVLPSRYESGKLMFPAVVSAPDFGQMLVTVDGGEASSYIEGNRGSETEDWVVQARPGAAGAVRLRFRPVLLAPPPGLKDARLWPLARRGWWNMFQVSSRWGDANQWFSSVGGVLANNVISDPCSVSLFDYADHALLLPELAPGISAMTPVRETLDWWLLHRMQADGEVPGYWDHLEMLDADPSLLISAWDYVEATGDRDWERQRLPLLERMADYLAGRDVDGDGIVEAKSSGNHDTLHDPARSCSSWDALNCGWKDAYCNALIYRAWLCLADMEKRQGRTERSGKYAALAARLKAAYFKTFYVPASGRLAWWASQDGQVHDLDAPTINGLAISYGLVNRDQGRAILRTLRADMARAGFSNFALGLPCALKPVPRGDYLQGASGFGVPQRVDGSDTFQQYLNGGCLVADAVWFLNAQYTVGETEAADKILNAMLARQNTEIYPNGAAFQNGVVNSYPGGAEFMTWSGQSCGYEGYLCSSFTFLDAVLTREPKFRRKLFRPLGLG